MSLEDNLTYSDESEAYKNFVSSIDSEFTKISYDAALSLFMKFHDLKEYDWLVKLETSKLETMVRDYIIYLRNN
ncbi:MAG TPA: hypothetical protein VH500_16880, partial [Nitrososphaeraceae archaeon]